MVSEWDERPHRVPYVDLPGISSACLDQRQQRRWKNARGNGDGGVDIEHHCTYTLVFLGSSPISASSSYSRIARQFLTGFSNNVAGVDKVTWVGLRNYERLFEDDDFWFAVQVTFDLHGLRGRWSGVAGGCSPLCC